MEIETRLPSTMNALEDPPTTPDHLNDIDVEAILNRPRRMRGFLLRQKACLNKAPEFVKRLNAFEEAKAGSTVTFECKWQAFPHPTIKWYKDDEEVVDNNRFRCEEVDGGTTKLHIDDCRKTDEGAYKCKAENAEGVASTTGYLSVAGDIKEKKLSAQPRKNTQHAVSNAPRLISITEQKSLELREEEEFRMMPPSPINDDIENLIKEKLLSHRLPIATESDDTKKVADIGENADDSGSDTSCDSQDFDRVPTIDPVEGDSEEEESPPVVDLVNQTGPSSFIYPEGQVETADGAVRKEEEEKDDRVIHESKAFVVLKPGGKLDKLDKSEIVNTSQKDETKKTSNTYNHAKLDDLQSKCILKQHVNITNHIHKPNSIKKTPPPKIAICSPDIYQPVVSLGSSLKRPIEISPEKLISKVSQRNEKSNLKLSRSNSEVEEATFDFPWLLLLGFSSFGSFLASATDLSPFWYIIVLTLLSMISFRFLVSTN